MAIIIVFMFSVFTLCASRVPFPDSTDNNFQNECLVAHNNYRLKHNTPSLKINNTMVAYAKSRCNITSEHEMLNNGHNGLVGYGENLYWSATSAKTFSNGSIAVKLWYDEIKQYNYSNPAFSSNTGHFTQVVWKSSIYIGCARCGGKGSKWYETYVVCNYSPLGNYLGLFKQNVLPPK